MKKITKIVWLFLLVVFVLSFSACDLFFSNNDVQKFNDELNSSTGTWFLKEDQDTFFTFDGSKGVMTFTYVEDGTTKYQGKYTAIYKGVGDDVSIPLTFSLIRNGNQQEDWINCYVDEFETDFTQFTIMQQEKDLGIISGYHYTHIYRISELPYKMGTYILEGKEYKQDADNYSGKDDLYIPSGTYSLESGESFSFLTIKPLSEELFQYKNGDITIEGVYTLSQDKKTIYLYLEHDPYSKITLADKDKYDTTFNTYYPPDFYLRGDFSNSDRLIIEELYHHPESPTQIQDSAWIFGTYNKI